jgi:O-antigen ligase
MDSKAKFKNLLIMVSLSAVIVMIDGFLQHYYLHKDFIRLYPSFKYAAIDHGVRYFPGFPTGPFPFPNDLSAWMLIVLMPALSLFVWGVKKLRPKFILGMFLFPFIFLFYLANARSAWLGFLASFFLTVFILSKKLFIVFVILILAAAIILFLLPREKTINILGLSSLQDRFYMWRIGWKIFKEHPVIGNGLNTGFHKFREYREDEYRGKKGSYFHNGFLQMAAEIGITGLLIFLSIIVKAFMSALGRASISGIVSGRDPSPPSAPARAFTLGLAGGLLAFLVHSFFDTNLQSLPLVILFWFSLALLMSMKNINAGKI